MSLSSSLSIPSLISPFAPTSSDELDPEDILSAAHSALFTDDTQNLHGMPGEFVLYHSPSFGELKIEIPSHPEEPEGRGLFAHFLWNAGIIAALGLELGSANNREEGLGNDRDGEDDASRDENRKGKVVWSEAWNVKGRNVLEVGAGAALPSMVAALSGARRVVVTDHPDSTAVTTGVAERNLLRALGRTSFSLPQHELLSQGSSDCETHVCPDLRIDVCSLLWSTSEPPNLRAATTNKSLTTFQPLSDHDLDANTSASLTTRLAASQSDSNDISLYQTAISNSKFDRIIVADCLWLPSQHANLVGTILSCLQPHPSHNLKSNASLNLQCSEAESSALVIAGFHTGRRTIARFLHIATGYSDRRAMLNPSPSSPSSRHSTSAATNPISADGNGTANGDSFDLDLSDLNATEREVIGKLYAAELYEIDIELNVRPWRREGWNLDKMGIEDKVGLKRWCVVAVLRRR